MKNVIFSYCNFQIHPLIPEYQKKAIEKNLDSHAEFKFLTYNAHDKDIIPAQVLEHGVNTLLEEGYDNILVLDVDCIPLSSFAIEYIFNKAKQGYLIGDIQRSNHIENNAHVFVGASCICFSADTFKQLGRPSFMPTARGDNAEELTFIAEEKNIPIEFFMPLSYETTPFGLKKPWDLAPGMPQYGIGTTFGLSDGTEMFYHLFDSRTGLNIEKFLTRCEKVITTNS